MSSDSDASAMTLGEFVGGEDATILSIAEFGDLNQAIEVLDPRERMIITYRFFREMSQADVAAKLNISQMHVSRLQNHALKTLKKLMSEDRND